MRAFFRTVGKASSEMKLYFSVPEAALALSESSAEIHSNIEGDASLEPMLNMRASYLSGQTIYGDAILANIGYTWRSGDLFFEDVSLSTYYRSVMALLILVHICLFNDLILEKILLTFYSLMEF